MGVTAFDFFGTLCRTVPGLEMREPLFPPAPSPGELHRRVPPVGR